MWSYTSSLEVQTVKIQLLQSNFIDPSYSLETRKAKLQGRDSQPGPVRQKRKLLQRMKREKKKRPFHNMTLLAVGSKHGSCIPSQRQ